MSLRGFHLVFITFATLLCAGLAGWCFFYAPRNSGTGVQVFGGLMVVASFGLPYYGVRFYKKAKNLIL